jgi:3-hydroxybutyryl-CoA dehydrogenase
MTINRVSVIGAGIMGSGIALACAQGAREVNIVDVDKKVIEQAFRRMNSAVRTLVQAGILTEEKAKLSLAHVRGTASMAEATKDVDLVIEAVPEKIDLKKSVFSELDEACPTHTIFASNTSTFSITEMAEATKRPERVLGAHWMNPPYLLPLVEVIPGAKTSEEVINIVRDFLTSLGKRPILCRDTPGFIVNRIHTALLVEAISLVEQGVATVEDVDNAWTQHLGLRYYIGPFEAMDSFGLDTELSQYSYLYEKLKETKFRPPDLLKKKVSDGELGLKTGKGFYDYAGKRVENIISERDRRLIEVLRLLKK